ncbi:hypothetical protein AHAS_Ahas20G0062700 [Arachis hypogaea]
MTIVALFLTDCLFDFRFSETPFRISLESPSGWKSPWFINTFLSSPRIDTKITIEHTTQRHSAGSSPRFTATTRSPLSAAPLADPPHRVLASRISPLSFVCAVCSAARASVGECSSCASCGHAACRRRPPSHTQRLVCFTARILLLFLQLCFLVSTHVSPRRASAPPSPLFRGCCRLNCCSSPTFCLCNNRGAFNLFSSFFPG